MSNYCIKELEQLSGIKAHTIRIWEKRYNLITPKRTCTNIRVYDDFQLKKLLNVSILIKAGYKISKIASLDQEELDKIVYHHYSKNNDTHSYIDQLVRAMIDYNEDEVNLILENLIDQFGVIDILRNVILPFADKIGILWQTNSISPAHEHFIFNLIRQKIITAIDQLQPGTNKDQKIFILYLPEGEWHEINLLFYSYYIKSQGHRQIYLGQDIHLHSLKDIWSGFPDSRLVTCLPSSLKETDIKDFISPILNEIPEGKHYLVVPEQMEVLFKDSKLNLVKKMYDIDA